MKSFEELRDEFYRDERILPINAPVEIFQKYLDQLDEIDVDNTNIEVLKFRAELLASTRKYEEGLAIYDKILKKKPDDLEVLKSKYGCLFALRKFDDCIRVCQRMLEIDPKNKDALTYWEMVYMPGSIMPKPPKTFKKTLDSILYVIVIIVIAVILCWDKIKSFYFLH